MTLGINFYTYQKKYQHYVTLILCYLFAILYGIWLQPNTVFIRNVCLIAGALISLPIIYRNRKAFLSKAAIPLWLIALLLAWVTFHLYFIGQEHSTQLMEYTKSWKKIAIGCVFALGLGLSLNAGASNACRNRQYWRMIYIGFTLPAVVYFFKLGITYWALGRDIEISPFFIHSREIFTDPFAIHRSGYVFFTLPALAIGLSRISNLMRSKCLSWRSGAVYLTNVLVISAIYVIESDRVGLLFVLGLISIGACKTLKSQSISLGWKKLAMLAIIFFGLLLIVGAALKSNSQWNTFFSDARIAVQVDRYDNWKYSPEYLPTNDLGIKASDSNYKRIAWLIVGSKLAVSHPLGYGLMSQSFGRFCKLLWPESQTSWSHSAWLDLTLGYGFPGALLLFAAAILALWNSRGIPAPWASLGMAALGVWIALFLVKELASEVYVNAFIFLVVMVSSLGLTGAMGTIHANDIAPLSTEKEVLGDF